MRQVFFMLTVLLHIEGESEAKNAKSDKKIDISKIQFKKNCQNTDTCHGMNPV